MPPRRPQLEVWGDHVRLDAFPATHRSEVVDGELRVIDPANAVVKRYPPGGWSAAGTQIVHAALTESDDCPVCAPRPAGDGA